ARRKAAGGLPLIRAANSAAGFPLPFSGSPTFAVSGRIGGFGCVLALGGGEDGSTGASPGVLSNALLKTSHRRTAAATAATAKTAVRSRLRAVELDNGGAVVAVRRVSSAAMTCGRAGRSSGRLAIIWRYSASSAGGQSGRRAVSDGMGFSRCASTVSSAVVPR